jgi:phospholipid N-methyltransferase
LIEHIRHFRTSGTIVRSSPFLINRLLRGIEFDRARTIVQLGVGTGCITKALLDRMRPDARLLSLELNRVFVDECEEAGDPRLVLRHACASDLPGIADSLGIGTIDYVVSSLPLAIMEDDLVERILAASQSRLSPTGLFLQYQYSLSQKDVLERRFCDVRVGFTLVNIPPAFVYECSGASVPEAVTH